MAAPLMGMARLMPHLKKAWPTVQKIGNAVLPGGAATPRQAAINAGMSLGPNALFAGMSAASLPEGTSLLDRALVGGENFLGSSLVELGAQGLAYGGIRMAGDRMSPDAQNLLRTGIAIGAPTIAWGSGALPQPNTARVWGRHNDEMMAQQEAQMEAQQVEIARAAREQAFQEMAGFGPMRQAYQGMLGGYG
jgi:hypothetical protein